jgi:hypothetical protein
MMLLRAANQAMAEEGLMFMTTHEQVKESNAGYQWR